MPQKIQNNQHDLALIMEDDEDIKTFDEDEDEENTDYKKKRTALTNGSNLFLN